MEDGMETLEKRIADLTEAFAAQDMVMRFSKAWDEDESNAALNVFISRLRGVADKKADRSARSLVLLGFAEHAEQSLARNNREDSPAEHSSEEDQ